MWAMVRGHVSNRDESAVIRKSGRCGPVPLRGTRRQDRHRRLHARQFEVEITNLVRRCRTAATMLAACEGGENSSSPLTRDDAFAAGAGRDYLHRQLVGRVDRPRQPNADRPSFTVSVSSRGRTPGTYHPAGLRRGTATSTSTNIGTTSGTTSKRALSRQSPISRCRRS